MHILKGNYLFLNLTCSIHSGRVAISIVTMIKNGLARSYIISVSQ